MSANKQGILVEKLSENWDTIADFFRQTQIPLSQETVRRAIYENEKVSTLTFIILTKYLGFTPTEIHNMLKKPEDYILPKGEETRYAREIADLIVKQKNAISQREEALIQCIRIVTNKDSEIWNLIVHFFSVLNKNMGIKGLERCLIQMEHKKTKKRRARP